MSDWEERVPGCFGNTDLIFAGHPLDENRAFDLLATLREGNVGWSEAKSAFRDHLEREGASTDHISNQISKIENRYRPWLLD